MSKNIITVLLTLFVLTLVLGLVVAAVALGVVIGNRQSATATYTRTPTATENPQCINIYGTLAAMGYGESQATFIPACNSLYQAGASIPSDCEMMRKLLGTPTPGFAECVEKSAQ